MPLDAGIYGLSGGGRQSSIADPFAVRAAQIEIQNRQMQAEGLAEQRRAIAEERQQRMAAAQREEAEAVGLRNLTAYTPETLFPIVGPEKGTKILKAMEDFRIGEMKNADDVRKSMSTRLAGLEALPESLRPEWYKAVVDDYAQKGLVDPSKVQPYSPEVLEAMKLELMTPEQRAARDRPIHVGDSLVKEGADGKYQSVYTAPPKENESGVGTLGDFMDSYAQSLGLKSGRQLSPPQKLKAKAQFEAAGRAPSSGSDAVEWVNRGGKAVQIKKGTAQLGDEPWTNARENQRKVTSGAAGRLSELDTALDDVGVLKSTLSSTKGATGTTAKIGAMLPNAVTDITGLGETAKIRQAAIDRVKQVIGKALEGGVLRKEDELKYEKILPTIADSPAVVEAKIKGLEAAIKQRKSRDLDALQDAGYDTSKFLARDGSVPMITPAGVPVMVPAEKVEEFIRRGGKRAGG
jgi:hypothetical protein